MVSLLLPSLIGIDGDGPETIGSFTLYLISDDSSEVRAQEFDLDGIAEGIHHADRC